MIRMRGFNLASISAALAALLLMGLVTTAQAQGTAPIVTQHPSNLTVIEGQQATFTAAATGTPTPSVIWQVSFDGGAVYHDIGWATTTTLTFTTIASHNGYRFRARFTNSAGSATTAIAMLAVNPSGPAAPVITQNPSNLTVTEGQQATFTAAATGTPTPSVIWQVSFDGGAIYHDIGWATTTTLTFTTIASHNGYRFRARFTNSAGSATTAIAMLAVNPSGPAAPVITQNPSNLTVTEGQQATFTAAASGTPTPSVIWQVSFDGGVIYHDIGWATTTTLTFTTIASHNGYLFRARFTNSVGSATTNIATLTLSTGVLPADRATTWNPGMMGVGGIPVRSTVCFTLTPRGGALDDTAQIQAAINACPAGQVVQLAAGTFIINSGNFLLINKGITLRGAGPG